ncbi:MAG: uroporphyrinogen decarboxylase [Alphaproteobacteria bacterium]
MLKDSKLVIETLGGNIVKDSARPIWLMRQAGRYLPEYHEIRKKSGSFLNLCYNPKLATEVSLQPINRFDFDASIVFSDILVIPDALGQKVDFIEGSGPLLEVINDIEDLNKLIPSNLDNFLNKLNPVYETIDNLKTKLPKKTTLIGFVGAPWTIITYMLLGKSNQDLNICLNKLNNDEQFTKKIFDLLIYTISEHLIMQIKAGSEVIQIFDSWAGFLQGDDYIKYSLNPIKKIVKNVRLVYPDIPIIGFQKKYKNENNNEKTLLLINDSGIDCISLEESIDKEYILNNLPKNKVIQGCLSSTTLKTGINLEKEIIEILDLFKNVPHIFNLGHGIDKDTPIKNVEFLVKTVREYKR